MVEKRVSFVAKAINRYCVMGIRCKLFRGKWIIFNIKITMSTGMNCCLTSLFKFRRNNRWRKYHITIGVLSNGEVQKTGIYLR